MPYNISCYFSLHSYTSTICCMIFVAISLSTPTYLQYATQYQLLFLLPLPHIYNMPHNMSCYFPHHCNTSTICCTISVALSLSTPTLLQYAVQYQLLFISALPHIYNMPHNICCHFSLHSHTSTICLTISVAISLCTPTHLQYAVQYQLLFLAPLQHIYNMPHNIRCYFSLHSHTSTICRTISVPISLCTPTHLQYDVQYQLLLFLSPLQHMYNMPHNISCYFSLHSHISTICRMIFVAISLSTPTNLQYATQY